MTNRDSYPECAICKLQNKACLDPQGDGPRFCPTLNLKESVRAAVTKYDVPEIKKLARMAAIQEAEGYASREEKPRVMYPIKPRVQEVIEFARKMQYKTLGIAFCVGLHNEARTLHKILETAGFKVVSVACKVGCIPKEQLGIEDYQKIRTGEFESMCNPIAQAKILNEQLTDFNVVVGLCVGHDSLFFKHSEAPVTVLVAKDRVLGHNPAAALYTSYYAYLLQE